MSERVFLDTNVLVYVFDDDSPQKQAIARGILGDFGDSADADCQVLSTQVLQEFFVVVTRKLGRPMSLDDAEAAVTSLARFPVVQFDASSVLAAIARTKAHQLSLWDALILQAAIEGGCKTLLSEDMQHGQTVDGVRIENPFRTVA